MDSNYCGRSSHLPSFPCFVRFSKYRVVVEPNDEFLILGCDGIWDCLTNENAVKFVRERIDTEPPTQIGREMLDEIISEDPRVTQGIGGDNMTIMIIDLQPSTRKWRREAPPVAAN